MLDDKDLINSNHTYESQILMNERKEKQRNTSLHDGNILETTE